MESEPPEDSSNSSYRGYRYDGGYGYNYGGYDAEPQEHRSLKDYIIIFRERFWLFLFCFAIIITGVLLYTLKKPKEYKSVAELRMERFGNTPIDTGNEKNQDNIGSHEDFNTWANILKSPTITSMVETRLKASEVDYNNFMEPYQKMDKNGDYIDALGALGFGFIEIGHGPLAWVPSPPGATHGDQGPA